MTGKTVKVLITFAIGQIIQIILQAVAINMSMWDNRRIAFCVAGGFLVLAAVVAGVFIADDFSTKKKAELDWEVLPIEEVDDEEARAYGIHRR